MVLVIQVQSSMDSVARYMSPDMVYFADASTRDEALLHMISALDDTGQLHDKEAFFQAILDREQIVSTGIGMGVAIPHAKLAGYDHFFIAVGVLKGGVDWDSLDGNPVRLIFMIGGPDDKQTEYLKMLSLLTTMLKDEGRRKRLMSLTSQEDVFRVFADEG